MKFRVDSTWRRVGPTGRVVLAGSPYRLFRLTQAGARIAQRIETGDDDIADNVLVSRLIAAGAIHPDHSAAALARDGSSDVRVGSGLSFSARHVTIVTPQLGGVVRHDGRITVDDGSVPPLDGAMLRLDRNRGPGAARNEGRRLATTPLIAFVDADVELLDDESSAHGGRTWLDPLLAHFDDPSVGLVAPRVLGDEHSSLDLGNEPARIRAGSRVSYVPAAAIVVRATAFDDIGGFDETLRFGEDVDLVWRLDQAGWTCRYEPGSAVWHQPRPSLVERLRQQAGYGSAAAPLAVRHPQTLAPFRSSGWTAGIWSLVAIGQPLAAIGLAAASSGALIAKLRDVPVGVALGIAMRGHLAAGRQLATALRRTWWPILAMSCLFSKRARVIAASAALADPRALPTDLAYGWGVWSGMRAQRTWDPIVPRLSASPGVR